MLVKCERLLDLISLQQSGQLAALSSEASRGLMQGLVLLCGSVKGDATEREEVFARVLDPSIQAITAFFQNPAFSESYEQDNYRKQVSA